MRKILIFIFTNIFLITGVLSAKEQYPNRYTAHVYVYNQSSQGIGGVRIWFHIKYYIPSLNHHAEEVGYGVTDGSGHTTIIVNLDTEEYCQLEKCWTEPDGPVSGYGFVNELYTYSYMEKTISPEYIMGTDSDNNGVYDPYETQLAAKFAPVIIMHDGNPQYPCPVEIMLNQCQIYNHLADKVFDYRYDGPWSLAFPDLRNSWNSGWWINWGILNTPKHESDWNNLWNTSQICLHIPLLSIAIHFHTIKVTQYNTGFFTRITTLPITTKATGNTLP